MANSRGFFVIPKCVDIALVNKLATEFESDPHRRKPSVYREKYNEYEVSPLGTEVKNDFVKVFFAETLLVLFQAKKQKNADKDLLKPFFPAHAIPSEPSSVNLGVFHKTQADPSRLKTANDNEIYVTIAVTDLGEENGWFTFYEGSHQRKPPFGDPVCLNLKAGDAVAWSGSVVYSHTSGGGGIFITLVYPLATFSTNTHAI